MNDGTQGALGDAVVWTVDEVNEFTRDFQSGVDESSSLDCPGREPRGYPLADNVGTVDGEPCCQGPEKITGGGSPVPPGFGIITSACHVFPQSRVRTNDRFLFLTEIGGPPCLKPFLDKLIADNVSSPHWGGTLVIDQPVTLKEPIQLPSVFTLAGVGIHGEGRLLFEGDFGDTPAITFQEFDKNFVGFIGKSVIRDIMISGPTVANKMRGIKIGTVRYSDDFAPFSDNAMGRFQFHRVHVANFGDYGMQGGMNTYTTLIDHCELIGNGTSIQLIFQCNSWRIRDCFISGATNWGVDVGAEISVPDLPPGALPNPQSGVVSDLLISGCRFIGNKPGAVRVQPGNNKTPKNYNLPNLAGHSTKNVVVFGNYFENNATLAVQVESAVVIPDLMKPNLTQLVSPLAGTRIVSNFFGANEKVSMPPDEDYNVEPIMVHSLWTQFGFNVSSDMGSILNTLKARRLDVFTILLAVAAGGAFSIANIACDPQRAELQAQEPGVARALCDYTPAPRWVLRDKGGVRVQAMVEPRCGPVGDSKGQCLPLEFGPSGSFPCVRVIDHEGRYINLLYELATGLIGPCNLIYEDDVEKKWKVDRGALYLQEGCEGDPYTRSGSGFQYGNPEFTSPRVVTYADGNFWYPSELSCFDLETPQWEYSVETQECYVPPQFFDVCVYRPMATWVHELLPNPPYTMEVEYD